MLWKGAAYGDEKAYMSIRNVEASSITTGMAVALRVGTSASFDGTQAVRAVSTNASDLPGFIGIAARDIAPNSYGIVQYFGGCASVFLSTQASSITINVGDPLVPSALAGALTSAAPTFANSGFKYVLASAVPTNTISAAGGTYISGWIH